jgi:hypothetical protein
LAKFKLLLPAIILVILVALILASSNTGYLSLASLSKALLGDGTGGGGHGIAKAILGDNTGGGGHGLIKVLF